jgi:hypothetical protein
VIAQRATMRPRGMMMALKVISPWDVGNYLCRLTDGKINLEDNDGGKNPPKGALQTSLSVCVSFWNASWMK